MIKPRALARHEHQCESSLLPLRKAGFIAPVPKNVIISSRLAISLDYMYNTESSVKKENEEKCKRNCELEEQTRPSYYLTMISRYLVLGSTVRRSLALHVRNNTLSPVTFPCATHHTRSRGRFLNAIFLEAECVRQKAYKTLCIKGY